MRFLLQGAIAMFVMFYLAYWIATAPKTATAMYDQPADAVWTRLLDAGER